MSEIKTLAGMTDDELRKSISSACKRHIPNIDLPPKYHVIIDALPMIYGEGMVKGYEFAESKFTEELAEKDAEIARLQQVYKYECEIRQNRGVMLSEANARNARLIEVLKMAGGGECTCKDERPCYGCRVQKIIDEAITANSEAVAAYDREVQAKALESAGLKWRKLHVFPDAAHILIEMAAELRAANKGKE